MALPIESERPRPLNSHEFEKNLAAKVKTPSFAEDLRPLLAPGIRYDVTEAAALVGDRLLARL